MSWAITCALNQARTEATRAGRFQRPDPEGRPEEREAPSSREVNRVDKLPAPGPSPEGLLLHSQCEPESASAADQLPQKQRLVIAHCEASGGGRADEIAAALGLTADAVRQNLRRARKGLEACLCRFGIDIRSELR